MTSKIPRAWHANEDARHGQKKDPRTTGKRRSARVENRLESQPNQDVNAAESETEFPINHDENSLDLEPNEADDQASDSELEADDEDADDSTEYSSLKGTESETEDPDTDSDEATETLPPDTAMLQQFKAHCDSHAHKNVLKCDGAVTVGSPVLSICAADATLPSKCLICDIRVLHALPVLM